MNGSLISALQTIADFPCAAQDNMPAANMRKIARDTLDAVRKHLEQPLDMVEMGRPEVVAWAVVAKYPHKETRRAVFFDEAQADTQGANWCCDDGVVTITPLIDRAFAKQHDCIVEALLADVERSRRTITGMNEAHAKLAGLYETAQTRVAELLAALERAATAMWNSDANMDIAAADAEEAIGNAKSGAPVAQAGQVPEGWKLVPVNATPAMVEALINNLTVTNRGTLLNPANAVNAVNAVLDAAPAQQPPIANAYAALASEFSAPYKPARPWRNLDDLVALHTEQLGSNPYAYFELAYTRRTGWMAWLCSHFHQDNPNREVIASGQADTPEGACAAAMREYRAKHPEGHDHE